MSQNNFDKKLEDQLLKNTQKAKRMKEEIWTNLEQELFDGEKEEVQEIEQKRKRRKKRNLAVLLSAAAAVLIAFSMQTDQVSALIKQAAKWFEPEKNTVQHIEGIEEESKVKLVEGNNAEYIIYIDKERYKKVKGENGDIIVPKEPLGDQYPLVQMTIEQINRKKPEELVKEMHEDMQKIYSETREPREVTEPLTGWLIEAVEGNEWDSSVERRYIIDNKKEGSFLITQRYFLEAEEGHGARFNEMLKHFEIIEQQD